MSASCCRSGAPVEGSWALFAALFAARTSIAYQFQSVPAATPYLVDLPGITHATIGLLIGCFMLPGVLLAIPGGLLDRRLGSRRAMLAGLAAMVAGGIAMLGRDPAWLVLGRVLGGAGAVILNVVLAKVVAERYPRHIVAVMGGFVASWPLGIALALVSVPLLAENAGPFAALVAPALPCAICALAIARLFRDATDGAAANVGRRTIGRAAIGLAVASGLVWGFYNVSYVVIVASLPEMLVPAGYSRSAAAGVASLLGWVLIVTLPLGGLLTQRFGHAYPTMVACLLLIAVSALLLVLSGAVLGWVAVLALLFGLPAGLIMALPAQAIRAEERSVGLGIFFTTFYACMAVLPPLAGWLRDVADTPGIAILSGGAVAVLAAACLVPFAMLKRASS